VLAQALVYLRFGFFPTGLEKAANCVVAAGVAATACRCTPRVLAGRLKPLAVGTSPAPDIAAYFLGMDSAYAIGLYQPSQLWLCLGPLPSGSLSTDLRVTCTDRPRATHGRATSVVTCRNPAVVYPGYKRDSGAAHVSSAVAAIRV
jgi:hypothetical protein